MTAPVFDPEAIARRVFDAEHAAVDEPHEPAPARPHDQYLPGTGQTRGRPLPTVAEGDGSDIFDRLERQREAKRVHSPIVLRDVPFEPTARARAERAAVEEQYVAPPLVQDDPADDVLDIELDDPKPESASPQVSEPPASRQTDTPMDESADEAKHDSRCGEQLTGGGAPRGWVLIRVIGSGAPRRYCGPTCARTALIERPMAGPERTAERQRLIETLGTRQPATRKNRRGGKAGPRRSAEQIAEVIDRYGQGYPIPAVASHLHIGKATVRRYLLAAGVTLRDDRTTNSGGHGKVDDPEFVQQLRTLYIEQGLSQTECAAALDTTVKVVQTAMGRNRIPARPSNLHHKPGEDHARPLKDLMAEHAITAAQVRAWARERGDQVPAVGLLPGRLVHEYLAAHPKEPA